MEKYRIDPSKGLEFGIYTLGDHLPDPDTGERLSEEERIHNIIELAKLADQAGLDFFGVGESHQEYFISQAHRVILSAVAQVTKNIKIGSSASVISTSDPIRLFEDFATIDLISKGRAEIIAGRASRTGVFDLLGYDLQNYDELYEEKFDLLLKINLNEMIDWEGEFRKPLEKAKVIPRPKNKPLPIWRATGGGPKGAMKAGHRGIPLFIAALAGPSQTFQTSIDSYREAAHEAGYEPGELPIATAGYFYTAETTQQAFKESYPHINQGMKLINGQNYPKQIFAQGKDVRNVMNIGSPEQIVEKILYQYEQFGHQRFIAQLDYGAVPFDKLRKNIELIGTEILPKVKKYTKKEED